MPYSGVNRNEVEKDLACLELSFFLPDRQIEIIAFTPLEGDRETKGNFPQAEPRNDRSSDQTRES